MRAKNSDYDNLKLFSLVEHGDRRERSWWHLVSNRFPAYETFWQQFVVPLTNRIVATVARDDKAWIRLRDDIPDEFERMAMHHYSVFYFLARTRERMEAVQFVHPEDVFYLLDALGDNLQHFFNDVSEVVKLLSGPRDCLPRNAKHECKALAQISDYRNAMLHDAVLGRAIHKGEEYLPMHAVLEQVRESWRKTDKLAEPDWISSKLLLVQLEMQATEYLERKWREIVEILHPLRESNQFKTSLKLVPWLPICAPQSEPTTNVPVSASGTFESPPPSGFTTLSSNTSLVMDDDVQKGPFGDKLE